MRSTTSASQEKFPLQTTLPVVPLTSGTSGSSSSPVIAARDEMNLAEFPLTVLSTRVNSDVKTLQFRDTQRLRTGEVLEREWIITAADKFGLPTSTEDDVILGLIRLTMERGFRERKVYFSRYELLQALRWSTEGRSYTRLTKSLDRLSGVRIKATNAFFDNASKSYQTKNFGIIDAYELSDGRAAKRAKKLSAGERSLLKHGVRNTQDDGENLGGSEGPSYFIWSEVLFDSFRAGFIKKIDMGLYFSLQSAVSRRLYRYLDKHFYYRSMIERNLMTLSFEKLGLSRNYRYVSSVKQQIEPAAEELVQKGFLESFEFEGRGEDTVVRFKLGNTSVVQDEPSTKVSQEKQSPHSYNSPATGFAAGLAASTRIVARSPMHTQDGHAVPSKEQTLISEALVSRGLTFAQGNRLLRERSAQDLSRIEAIIRYYDHLVETNDIRISKNRVGFLYRAVESPFKFTLPAAFAPSLPSVHSNATGTNSEQTRRSSKRPELKIFRASEILSEANSTQSDTSDR